jgi:hypothetical protein
MMFDRNQLVHAVIWPNEKPSQIALVDAEGEVRSTVTFKLPMRGSDVAKWMPDGYQLDVGGCTVVSMSGRVMVNTVAPFDSAVVTERPEVTFEDRMLRLERRDKRREERAAQLERQYQTALTELREQREEVVEDVTDDDEPRPRAGNVSEPSVVGDDVVSGDEVVGEDQANAT